MVLTGVLRRYIEFYRAAVIIAHRPALISTTWRFEVALLILKLLWLPVLTKRLRLTAMSMLRVALWMISVISYGLITVIVVARRPTVSLIWVGGFIPRTVPLLMWKLNLGPGLRRAPAWLMARSGIRRIVCIFVLLVDFR